MHLFKWFVLVCLLCGFCDGASATTWYVRADGGTRYSAHAKEGQCDGKGDAAYPGDGVNRHCAFSDYRYLWDDRATYGATKWAIAGGDTVILDNTRAWRVGFDQGKTANDPWCFGGNGAGGCTNPTIPSGTAAQPTRILGRHSRECSTAGKTDRKMLTQIFGGYGLGTVFNLGGAQYVEVECLEITRHSQCATHGDPRLPSDCQRYSGPTEDFDADGIGTDQKTHDVLLQDIWVHGHTDRGIIGPIGGLVTARRVDVAFNAMAGWDFDDGRGTPSINGDLRLLDSIIEWNGCSQEYPVTHPNPAIACNSQSSGGYGDGIGTPANMGMDVTIDHSIFRYNTQDGEDFGHVDTGSHRLRITNSISYGNGGGQFKWGGNFTNVVFANNLVIANCMRMSKPIEGTPANFNAHLADFCRAQDAISFNYRDGGVVLFDNNTILSYAPTTFDIQCWDKNCSASKLYFRNNIVVGVDNPSTYSLGGRKGGAGGFYFAGFNGKTVREHNLFSGMRNVSCIATEICADPRFVSLPRFTQESDLDHVDLHLSANSPAKGTGVNLPDLHTDLAGQPRSEAARFDLGAYQSH